jgi:hypothetical protein
VHATYDLLERTTLSQREPDGAIAALGAGTGRDEVTHPGQAAEREDFSSQRHPEAAELGEAAGDEYGAGVVAETEAVADPGGDGHDILCGSSDLTTDDVGACVGAERLRVDEVLDPAGQILVGQRHHAGGGVAGRDLPGQVWAGQHAGGHVRQHLCHHLRHAEVGADLDALGETDDGLDVARQGRDITEHGAKAVRRHGHEDDAHPVERLLERGSHSQVVGKSLAGKILAVLTRLAYRRREVRRANPQRGGVRGADEGGHGRAP